MVNTTGFLVAHKPRKHRLSPKQKASSLFRLWHSIQDLKEEAEQLKDSELGLLIGMIELLVEERTASLGTTSATVMAPAATASAH